MKTLKEQVKRLLYRVKPLDHQVTFSLYSATAKDFEKFEKDFSIFVPQSLKEWLMFCNGASIHPGEIYGINNPNPSLSIEFFYNNIFREWIPLGWIPIASDGCGDYYIVDTKYSIDGDYPIYFVDQEDYTTPAYIVASNVWHFFYFLFTNEILENEGKESYWPFNKPYVIAKDPNILKFTKVSFPWD